MTKYSVYREELANGLSPREIAEKHGCSRQNVYAAIGQGKWFKPFTEKTCIYTGLRNWLNENRMSKKQVLIALGMSCSAPAQIHVRNLLESPCHLNKLWIDRFIDLTCLSYEELFGVTE